MLAKRCMCADKNGSLPLTLCPQIPSLTGRLARGNADNLTGVGQDQALRLARYFREQCYGCGRLSREVTQIESMSSMRARVNGFLRDHILPEMASHATGGKAVIAVVGHGVILQVLWACFTEIFGSQSFHLARDAESPGTNYMHPLWSNTGIMEVDIRPGGPPEELLITNMIHPHVEPPWLMRAFPA